MAIKAKSLTSEELDQIKDEWEDSTVVTKLLGHIMYLTDALIRWQANVDTSWMDKDND